MNKWTLKKWILSFLSLSIPASPILASPMLISQDLAPNSLPVDTPSSPLPVNRRLIPYLLQSKDLKQSLELYRKYQKEKGHHDFEVLTQIAHILLFQGAKSSDSEQQLLSIYGCGLGGVAAPIDVLESGLSSSAEYVQVAAVQCIGSAQDDLATELLIRAMSSDFFETRFEAAFQLAVRKHPNAIGQIESLMQKLHPQLRFFFVGIFSMIGTPEAISIVRHLIEDPYPFTRIIAILTAAGAGRDDLLPLIRAAATHSDYAEQETCATALGVLRDSKSTSLIQKLAKSPIKTVQIAALTTLYSLGDKEAGARLIQIAEKELDPFAITALEKVEGSEPLLIELLSHPHLSVRINAASALLEKKDPRCRSALLEVLIRDTRDLAITLVRSPGQSLVAWKVIPSASVYEKKMVMGMGMGLVETSVSLREQMLAHCLNLPESDFLWIAQRVLKSKQSELVPVLIHLLEHLQTKEALALLKQEAESAGAPFNRCYSALALMRLRQAGPWEAIIRNWIRQHQKEELVRFRPVTPLEIRLTNQKFELTPEENSRLLIEALQTVAELHASEGIDIILELIENGNPKNRPPLAGLLLHLLQ